MFLHTVGLLLLIAVSAIGYNSVVNKVCPSEVIQAVQTSYYFRVLNNTCFLFMAHDYELYEIAKQKCYFGGGSLAMPKTKIVNDFLLEQMKQITPYQPMWIGMNDIANEGIWMWEDGTDVVSWGNMNYFNGGWFGTVQNCMALDPGDNDWHDQRCLSRGLIPNAKLAYICQYSKQADHPSGIRHGLGGSFDNVKDQGYVMDNVKGQNDSYSNVKDEGDKDGDGKDQEDVNGQGHMDDNANDQGIKNDKTKGQVDMVGDAKGQFDKIADVKSIGDKDEDDKDQGDKLGPLKDKGGKDEDAMDQGYMDDQGDKDDDVNDQGDEDICRKFDCPDLDCGMDGFKIRNGCQLCECN